MTPKSWLAPNSSRPVDADVTIPGSKSLTNRELVLSALADGSSCITGALQARDTELMIEALVKLGAQVKRGACSWTISPIPSVSGSDPITIECGLAGTVMRFIPAVAALSSRPVRFTADEQAYARPMNPLFKTLRSLGVSVHYEGEDAYPLTVQGRAVVPGPIEIDASASSQFLSALLLVAPLLQSGSDDIEIRLVGKLPSRPHIDMTIASLSARGVQVQWLEPDRLLVQRGSISARETVIEPDLSNAGPFLAAAAVTNGHVRIPFWPLQTTQAGDMWQEILTDMGQTVCLVPAGTHWGTLSVRGSALRGIVKDMSQCGELVPTLAALCALADSPSRIEHIGHLRGHETDRIEALTTELRKLGVDVEAGADYLAIDPTNGWQDRLQEPVELCAYADHRMATFAAIVGLCVPGIYVDDIGAVSKTMPDFEQLWQRMLHDSADSETPQRRHVVNAGDAEDFGSTGHKMAGESTEDFGSASCGSVDDQAQARDVTGRGAAHE